jgi:hypothetical protein
MNYVHGRDASTSLSMTFFILNKGTLPKQPALPDRLLKFQ